MRRLYRFFRINLLIVLCAMSIGTSCDNTESHMNTDEYSFKALTPELIKELGGVSALYKYQFYLSDSFELMRVENEKSFTNKGYVDNLDNNFKVIFNKYTPGIFKCADMKPWGEIDCIHILFDENDLDYLTFRIDEDSYNRNHARFYHAYGENNSKVDDDFDTYSTTLQKEDNGYSAKQYRDIRDYRYKGVTWNKKLLFTKKEKRKKKYFVEETYLIIRIRNLSTTTTEKAKGRSLAE